MATLEKKDSESAKLSKALKSESKRQERKSEQPASNFKPQSN